VEQVCDRVAILQRGRLVHLQTMSELRQSRLVRASFPGPPLPVPPGDHFRVREQANGRVEFEHTGPLPDLLDWLGRQPLTDLSVEPLGLAPIYHRYHGVEP
jgi:ABC-2 type transport system ATP-binding protein